jgi:hypothetical protein
MPKILVLHPLRHYYFSCTTLRFKCLMILLRHTRPPNAIYGPSGHLVDALEGFRSHPVMVGRGCLAVASRGPLNWLRPARLRMGCGCHPVPSGSAWRWSVMVGDGRGCLLRIASTVRTHLAKAPLQMGCGCHPVPATSGPLVVFT